MEEERAPEEMKIKRKGGAPFGNQNAITHGFYSKVLTSRERRSLAMASDIEGLDYEIALLRVKIKSLVDHDPDNVELITRAVNALTRMPSDNTIRAVSNRRFSALLMTLPCPPASKSGGSSRGMICC